MIVVESEEISVKKSKEVDMVESEGGKDCEEVKSGSDCGNGCGSE